MKFMRKTVKYIWQDYKNNEDILSEFKINSNVKNFQNYTNKCVKHMDRTDRDKLLHLIVKYQPCGICLMFIHICPYKFVLFCSVGLQTPTLTNNSHNIQTVEM